jgi:FKBP12-rapamycin complex-associated protein
MIIEALQDNSFADKQESAVIALGKIVRSLGMVSEPYAEYPELFDSLVQVIQRTEDEFSNLRIQAIKTIGILGVVEQNKFEEYLLHIDAEIDKEKDLEDVPDILAADAEDDEDEVMKLDRYYLSVIIKSLMKILRDDSLHHHHQSAAIVAVNIVKILGKQTNHVQIYKYYITILQTDTINI